MHTSTLNPSAVQASPTHRRLRAAFALLRTNEKQASDPTLPLDTRSRSLIEAQRHLGAAWSLLTTWGLSGASGAELARAGELLGEVNRRLPLLASALRAESGHAMSFDKDGVL